MSDDGMEIAILRTEVKNLHLLVSELKTVIERLHDRLGEVDNRHNEVCRDCKTWTRIRDLEIAVAEAKGVARGWSIGASAVTGGLSFLAAWVLRK